MYSAACRYHWIPRDIRDQWCSPRRRWCHPPGLKIWWHRPGLPWWARGFLFVKRRRTFWAWSGPWCSLVAPKGSHLVLLEMVKDHWSLSVQLGDQCNLVSIHLGIRQAMVHRILETDHGSNNLDIHNGSLGHKMVCCSCGQLHNCRFRPSRSKCQKCFKLFCDPSNKMI